MNFRNWFALFVLSIFLAHFIFIWFVLYHCLFRWTSLSQVQLFPLSHFRRILLVRLWLFALIYLVIFFILLHSFASTRSTSSSGWRLFHWLLLLFIWIDFYFLFLFLHLLLPFHSFESHMVNLLSFRKRVRILLLFLFTLTFLRRLRFPRFFFR